jgi:hypothetical protein
VPGLAVRRARHGFFSAAGDVEHGCYSAAGDVEHGFFSVAGDVEHSGGIELPAR